MAYHFSNVIDKVGSNKDVPLILFPLNYANFAIYRQKHAIPMKIYKYYFIDFDTLILVNEGWLWSKLSKLQTKLPKFKQYLLRKE